MKLAQYQKDDLLRLAIFVIGITYFIWMFVVAIYVLDLIIGDCK